MKSAFTDVYIKSINKPGRYTDAATAGLNFNVKANGLGYWVFSYQFGAKRLDLSLGAYPAIPLKEARKRAIASRNEILKGSKPTAYWKLEMAQNDINQPLFGEYAKKCIEAKKAEWKNPKHIDQCWRRPKIDPVCRLKIDPGLDVNYSLTSVDKFTFLHDASPFLIE